MYLLSQISEIKNMNINVFCGALRGRITKTLCQFMKPEHLQYILPMSLKMVQDMSQELSLFQFLAVGGK